MSSSSSPYILVAICIALLGIQGIFEKLSLKHMHFSVFAFLRFLMCAALCLLLLTFSHHGRALGVHARLADMKRALLTPWLWLSACATALGGFIYYKLMSSQGLAYMTMTWPAMMAISVVGASIIFKEVIKPRRYFGILLAVSGSVIALL